MLVAALELTIATRDFNIIRYAARGVKKVV